MKLRQILEVKVHRDEPEMDELNYRQQVDNDNQQMGEGPYAIAWHAQSHEWYGEDDPSTGNGRYKPKDDGGKLVAINVPTYAQAQEIANDLEAKAQSGELDPALNHKWGEDWYLLDWRGVSIKPMSSFDDWEIDEIIKWDKPIDFKSQVRENEEKEMNPNWVVRAEWDGVPSDKVLFSGTKPQCLKFISKNWDKYNKGKGSIGLFYPKDPSFGWSAGRAASFVLDD